MQVDFNKHKSCWLSQLNTETVAGSLNGNIKVPSNRYERVSFTFDAQTSEALRAMDKQQSEQILVASFLVLFKKLGAPSETSFDVFSNEKEFSVDLSIINDSSTAFQTIELLKKSASSQALKNNIVVSFNVKEINDFHNAALHITIDVQNGNVKLNWIYDSSLLSGVLIRKIAGYYELVISQVISDKHLKISKINVLTNEEKEQILNKFNATEKDYPFHKNVVELIETTVAKQPDAIAVLSGNEHMSYKMLNDRANALAAKLHAEGVVHEDIIGIISGQSTHFIIGVLAVLKCGAAFLPIDAEYPEARINYLLEDSKPKRILSYPEAIDKCDYDGDYINLSDHTLSETIPSNPEIVLSADALAYIIYTSGSTGQPKGTLIAHQSLTNLCYWHNDAYAVTTQDQATKYAGIGFDATVWEIFPYLVKGATLHVIPEDIRMDVSALNDYYNTHRITISFLPTQVCEQFVKQNNQSLRLLLTGGDKLKDAGNVPYKIANNYGPTENTVVTTSFIVESEGSNIPIGKPIANQQVYILGHDDALCPVGVRGELCIGGVGLSMGYLNQPELNIKKFVNNPHTGERMYRSGDLARWLPDGNIEYLGRIDEQVKIRGNRIELGEIEYTLTQHKAVTSAVVLVNEKEDDKYLVAYYTGKKADVETIKDWLREKLPEYMVPSFIINVDEMPLTANGKVNKRALPQPEEASTGVYVAHTNHIEETVIQIFSEILILPVETISVTTGFLSLGGHSLRAAAVSHKIAQDLAVKISIKDILRLQSARAISRFIHDADKDNIQPIGCSDEVNHPLSAAQQRLYFLYQQVPTSTAYNLPQYYYIDGKVDYSRLNNAFKGLLDRHASLRTHYFEKNGHPCQEILTDIIFELEFQKSSNNEIDRLKKDFIQPFDLSRGQLIRAKLLQVTNDSYVLMMDTHHIANDGTSQSIINKELSALYNGERLAEGSHEFVDYVHWQTHQPVDITHKEFWRAQFSGDIPMLNLPLDFVRKLTHNKSGTCKTFNFNSVEAKAIREFALNRSSTPYVILLTAFKLLLSRLSGQDDIVVGTPTAGRKHPDIVNTVGMFVDTIPLRSNVRKEHTLSVLEKNIRNNVYASLEADTFGYDKLVEELKITRVQSRNPLFDVMFVYQNYDQSELTLDKTSLTKKNQATYAAKFDLTLEVTEEHNQLLMTLEYDTGLFKPESITRFNTYFRNIVFELINNPEQQVSELNILTPDERELQLETFNDKAVEFPKEQTVISIFEDQVLKTPGNVAIKSSNGEWSYKKVSQVSNKIATFLMDSMQVERGGLVALLLNRDDWLIPTIFGVIKAGAAYLPVDGSQPEDRIRAILDDANITTVITRTKHLHNLPDINVVNLDEDVNQILECEETQYIVGVDDLAYVIYTSGSTGKPKGVMVEHNSLHNIISGMQLHYPLTEDDCFILKTNYAFDVSAAEIFGWFYEGGAIAILDAGAESDPPKIAKAISSYDVTHINFAPSMFNLFLEHVEAVTNQIRSLKYIFVAGEALPVETVRRYQMSGIPAALENIYGPTEGTIYSVGFSVSDLDLYRSVPIGKPLPNILCYILDEHGQLLPLGAAGELYIGGAAVTRGYLSNEQLTKEKFVENPFKSGERLYKTGDLVRWLDDGNIECLGRIDHQIKLRGFRIELGEIEHNISKFPNINEVICLLKGDQDKFIVAYYVADNELDEDKLNNYLEQKLPHYMVPQYFIKVEEMPLTNNGKINHKQLPDPESTIGAEDFVGPVTNTEIKIAAIWSEVLEIDKEAIGVNITFFNLGGHSLKAGFLLNKIHKTFGKIIELKDFFSHNTVRLLASLVDCSNESTYNPITRTSSKSSYKLSSAQQRLLYLYDLDQSSLAYNIPLYIKLKGDVHHRKLEQAFIKLIDRHDILRTYFGYEDEGAVQMIAKDVPFALEISEVHSDQISEAIKLHVKAFDLGRAPMLRACLLSLSDRKDESLLVIDSHHIITDGVSESILMKELVMLYDEQYLPEPTLQYKDFAEWQQDEEHTERADKDKKFWLNEYVESFTPVNLPLDYERQAVKGFEGETISFNLGSKETERLNKLASNMEVTLYAVLLSAFNIFLSKLCNQEDIIVGSPTAGRSHVDLEDVVGMFVNTLPMRNNAKDDLSFREFVINVYQRSVACFDHQHYPYEELVQELKLERNPARNPVFDVVFVLQNTEKILYQAGSLAFEAERRSVPVSKFDLTFEARELEDDIVINCEYSTDIFKAETIHRFIQYFNRIIAQVSIDVEVPLSDIDILTAADKNQIITEFNVTEKTYPLNKTVMELIEHTVSQFPEAIALVNGNDRITYKILNDRANALATRLRVEGVGHEDIVCIISGQSIHYITGLLGILKSGAAFLPIDAEYPKDRINYLLEDSKYKKLVSYPQAIERSNYEGDYIDLSDHTLYEGKHTNLDVVVTASSLAYVIYTSGSTGKPKGTQIEHHSLLNLCCWHNEAFEVTSDDHATKYAGIGFDASVWEIFPYLLKGATLHIIPEQMRLDVAALNEYYNSSGITISFLPTQVSEQFIKEDNQSLRLLLVGGDKLKNIDNKTYSIVNNYGPTENTVVTTSYTVKGSNINIPIGKPIANNRIYILGKSGSLCPIGVAGELCISGEGLSRGYLHKEALTKERFVPNPFHDGKMYLTGDLARWRPDGNIEYLGRIDEQVKIRGNRIELGEIEHTLTGHEEVTAAVVVVHERYGDKYLVGYYTGTSPGGEMLKAYLSEKLPQYMVPVHLLNIEAIPLTVNGKVNKQALPAPELDKIGEFVAPEGDVQLHLAKIWADILKVDLDVISASRSFYDTGGHSLNAATMLNKVHKKFDVKISFQEFFGRSTIQLMAEYIEVHSWLNNDDEKLNKFEITI